MTDGEQTETNYFEGLKNSFPEELRRKIRIKVISQIDTEDLISVAMKEAREDATFRKIWIVFDRDDRPNDFDTIIAKAEKNGIKIGWSNPCIEIFFHAYYGFMPNNYVAKQCITEFSKAFKKHSGKVYKKNDPEIYAVLLSTGNEPKALQLSEKPCKTPLNYQKLRNHLIIVQPLLSTCL